jgi:hypothetical protein
MTSYQVALGALSLSVLLLGGCATKPTALPHAGSAASAANECPPLFGKVCYGPTDRPDIMRCGCSSVSPLGTPYP